jgi:hypothetical protein
LSGRFQQLLPGFVHLTLERKMVEKRRPPPQFGLVFLVQLWRRKQFLAEVLGIFP